MAKTIFRFEISNTEVLSFYFDKQSIYLLGYLVSNFLTWPFLYPVFWFCIYGFETISLSKQKRNLLLKRLC